MYGNKIIIQVKTITRETMQQKVMTLFSFVCLWHGMRHDILNETTQPTTTTITIRQDLFSNKISLK